MNKTNPFAIAGPWADGRVLDVHSTGSEFLGQDDYGHERFDTHRTYVGKLLYNLKYRGDDSAIEYIGEVAEPFIRSWRLDFDCIVPAPPTRVREIQPVHQLAYELAIRLHLPVIKAVTKKPEAAAELKNLHDFREREAVLRDALVVKADVVAGRRVLLVDDLIRSGATLSAVANALTNAGAATILHSH